MTSLPDDPADCFCALWDQFSVPWGEENFHEFNGPELAAFAARLAQGILDEGAVPESLRDRAGKGAKDALIAAAAIEWVLMQAHPAWRTPNATNLVPTLVARYETTRCLNDTAPGALLFRFAEPATDRTPENLFPTVTRVPAALWDSMNLVIPTTLLDLDVTAAPVVVGCVPSAMSMSDFEFTSPVEGRYSLAPRPTITDPTHIRCILSALDESGAVVGVLPEGVLDDAALEAWKEVIRNTPPRRGAPLRWILVGTGPIGAALESAPPNRAVLIGRHKGQVICEQDKRYGFDITPEQLRDWLLAAYVQSDESLNEHIVAGKILALVECLRSRYVILVCEDLSRGRDDGAKHVDAAVVAASPSFLLVPVFDRELRQGRWIENHSKDWARRIGAHAVVSNSGAVASTRRQADLISDEAMVYSAAFWCHSGDVTSDFVGCDGGGSEGAHVTLYEMPKSGPEHE